MDESILAHYGTLGMKWGRRRYQNKDGSLTAAGRKRYSKELAKIREEEKIVKNKQATKAKIDRLNARRDALEEKKKALNGDDNKDIASKKPESETKSKSKTTIKKSVKDMSDEELNAVVNRLNLEKRYNDAMKETDGRKFNTRDVIIDIAESSVKNIGKQAFSYALGAATNKIAEKVFGVTGDSKGMVNPAKGQKDK